MATDVKVDFKDVWTAVTDVAHELSSDATVSMASNAFVLPKGIASPDQLTGWVGSPSQMHITKRWESQWFLILTTPTRIRVGASWYYGGGVDGQGRYLANAEVYFVLESIGQWEKFKVEGHFDSPLIVGNAVAQLSGTINIGYYEYSSLSSSPRAQFQLRGDGSGNIWWA